MKDQFKKYLMDKFEQLVDDTFIDMEKAETNNASFKLHVGITTGDDAGVTFDVTRTPLFSRDIFRPDFSEPSQQ